MAIGKSARTLTANAALAVGAASQGALDLTASYGLSGTARIVPAGTLTTGCLFTLDVSNDGTTWRNWMATTSGLASGVVYDYQWSLPPEIMHIRATFSGHVGNAVAVDCYGHELTSI